jgi:peptidoglycan/LPS O-acetylase OafA/YrhL
MEKRIYFRNLNGLRFIAATAVIFHHVEQYKFWAKVPSLWGNTFVDALGQKAVSFFFVLSGFLISYLLLEEHKKTSTISIRDFYIRRTLRIWPVYYLVVILCLFVVPNLLDLSFLGIPLYDGKFPLKVVFLFLVLPNLLRVYSPNIVGGNQLWSIGVEEQFYVIWPLLVKRFLNNFLAFLIWFIVFKLAITVLFDVIVMKRPSLLTSALHRFWVLLKVEQMAIGAIGAWILFYQKDSLLRVIFDRRVWFAGLVLLAVLMIAPLHHWMISYFEAVVFLILIMNLAANSRVGVSLENPVLSRLGNISYGIYMYHTLCITMCIYVLHSLGIADSNLILFNVLLYCTSVILTIGVAYLSYEYFEKVFLNFKEKFMIVKSGKPSGEKKEGRE